MSYFVCACVHMRGFPMASEIHDYARRRENNKNVLVRGEKKKVMSCCVRHVMCM